MKTTLLAACAVCAVACTTVEAKPAKANHSADSTQAQSAIVHGAQIYVSAVNCEMNAEDAERINALARVPGLLVEVVFTGISNKDSSIVEQARRDLGLTAPARLIRDNELLQYKSIGTTRLPMALVIKGRQLKTLVAGEALPRTLSILEASLTSASVPSALY